MNDLTTIAYGINPLLEAFNSPALPQRVYVQSGKSNKRIDDVIRAAQNAGVPVETVGNLQKYCGQNAVHQGVAAEFGPGLIRSVTQLPEDADRVILFDGIADPHNFGAALRVCEVFGFPNIIFHKGDSSGLTPVAIKSSAGAAFHVSLFITNLNRAIKLLRERGFSILALEAGGEDTIHTVKLPKKLALVIGSEGKGVRFNLRREADALVQIPMYGKVNSLNVSCALSAALSVLAPRLQA